MVPELKGKKDNSRASQVVNRISAARTQIQENIQKEK